MVLVALATPVPTGAQAGPDDPPKPDEVGRPMSWEELSKLEARRLEPLCSQREPPGLDEPVVDYARANPLPTFNVARFPGILERSPAAAAALPAGATTRQLIELLESTGWEPRRYLLLGLIGFSCSEEGAEVLCRSLGSPNPLERSEAGCALHHLYRDPRFDVGQNESGCHGARGFCESKGYTAASAPRPYRAYRPTIAWPLGASVGRLEEPREKCLLPTGLREGDWLCLGQRAEFTAETGGRVLLAREQEFRGENNLVRVLSLFERVDDGAMPLWSMAFDDEVHIRLTGVRSAPGESRPAVDLWIEDPGSEIRVVRVAEVEGRWMEVPASRELPVEERLAHWSRCWQECKAVPAPCGGWQAVASSHRRPHYVWAERVATSCPEVERADPASAPRAECVDHRCRLAGSG